MKPSILLTVFSVILLGLSSCNENNDSNSGLGGFSATGISGIKTATNDNYSNWNAVPNIHFYATETVNYSYWILEIGDSQGYLKENITGADTHWRGRISYIDKDKWCNDIIYADSLQLDITNNEAGWNEATFQTTSYTSTNGAQFVQTGSQCIYYAKASAAGNINTINISDANHGYMFKFKTNATDNFNSWKTIDMQDGWMSNQARISLFLIPVLFTIFQQ